jgi:hypothetical protein
MDHGRPIPYKLVALCCGPSGLRELHTVGAVGLLQLKYGNETRRRSELNLC